VPALDFCTSAGAEQGGGLQAVITDFGILRPRGGDGELVLAALYPEATAAEARAAVGWPLALAETLEQVPPPTELELRTLRELEARTAAAHSQPVVLALPALESQ